jgi:hypothetical protein
MVPGMMKWVEEQRTAKAALFFGLLLWHESAVAHARIISTSALRQLHAHVQQPSARACLTTQQHPKEKPASAEQHVGAGRAPRAALHASLTE